MQKAQLDLPGIFPPGAPSAPADPGTSAREPAPTAAENPATDEPDSSSMVSPLSRCLNPCTPKPGGSPDSVLDFRSPSPLPGGGNPGNQPPGTSTGEPKAQVHTAAIAQPVNSFTNPVVKPVGNPGSSSSAPSFTGPQKRAIPEWMQSGKPAGAKARRMEALKGNRAPSVGGGAASAVRGPVKAEELVKWLQSVEAVRLICQFIVLATRSLAPAVYLN